MKKPTILLMAIIGLSSGATFAESITWQPINSGVNSYDSGDSSDRNSSYESSSGNQYQGGGKN